MATQQTPAIRNPSASDFCSVKPASTNYAFGSSTLKLKSNAEEAARLKSEEAARLKSMPSFKKPQQTSKDDEDSDDEDASFLAEVQAVNNPPQPVSREQIKPSTVTADKRSTPDVKEQILNLGKLEIIHVDGVTPSIVATAKPTIGIIPNFTKNDEDIQYSSKTQDPRTGEKKIIPRQKRGLVEFVNTLRKSLKLSHAKDWNEAAKWVKVRGPAEQVYLFSEIYDIVCPKITKVPVAATTIATAQPQQQNNNNNGTTKDMPKLHLNESETIKQKIPETPKPETKVREISKEKFMQFHSVHLEGKYDMITDSIEAMNIAGLLEDEYFNIIRNYNSLSNKYLGEHSTDKKRKSEVLIRYFDTNDFMNQVVTASSRVFNVSMEDSMVAFKMVNTAIENLKSQTQMEE